MQRGSHLHMQDRFGLSFRSSGGTCICSPMFTYSNRYPRNPPSKDLLLYTVNYFFLNTLFNRIYKVKLKKKNTQVSLNKNNFHFIKFHLSCLVDKVNVQKSNKYTYRLLRRENVLLTSDFIIHLNEESMCFGLLVV